MLSPTFWGHLRNLGVFLMPKLILKIYNGSLTWYFLVKIAILGIVINNDNQRKERNNNENYNRRLYS